MGIVGSHRVTVSGGVSGGGDVRGCQLVSSKLDVV
jgi:hypothetical protein